MRATRRSLLKGSAAASLVVAVGGVRLALRPDEAAAAGAGPLPTPLGAFLRIGADETVTFVAPCVEMGQGSQTALAVIAADELGADPSRLSVVMAQIDPAYNVPGTTMQYVSGSQSVRRWDQPLRRSAAAAREMLVAAAARAWSVPPETCQAEGGAVLHAPTGRRMTFGALAGAASALPVPADPVLRTGRTLVGRDIPRLDIPSKVDGSAVFGADVRLPGMVYAARRQSPVFRAKLVSVDVAAVAGRRGVIEVVKLADAAAVVADSYWRAQAAVDALDLRFASPPQARYTTAGIAESHRLQLESPTAVTAIRSGDAEAVMDGAEVSSADYRVPYLYHATMETMTCTVSISDGSCEYWVPTQWMSAVAELGVRLTGLPPAKVAVHATFLGGGFGRKFALDYVEQATLIAKAVKRPVQLIWSRSEDVQHGFYRPMTTARVRGVLKDGTLEAMSIRVVGASIPEFRAQGIPFTAGYDPRAVLGLSTETSQAPGKLQQYAVEHFTAEAVYQPAHVPCGSWRSVGASENGFFVESFIDELAHQAGQDPYEFRRRLLRNSPRGLATLDRAAGEARWTEQAPAGRHRGIAFSECVGSMVAQVVEVSVTGAEVVVHRVWCAIDCGTAVSPDGVRAQVMGAVVMGLSTALHEEITIEAGRCAQSNFSDYRVLSLAETPEVNVYVVESGYPLGGVAEAGVPSTAPALCNAIFQATGKRIRSLPVRLDV